MGHLDVIGIPSQAEGCRRNLYQAAASSAQHRTLNGKGMQHAMHTKDQLTRETA